MISDFEVGMYHKYTKLILILKRTILKLDEQYEFKNTVNPDIEQWKKMDPDEHRGKARADISRFIW